ncbi:MAG TPA: chemotaxis protein CheB [Actinomycetes bacterium]|nr:chemotaxis protein CheB [Actinomycetes bacterium]
MAIVAGTKTRVKALEKLLAQPGVIVSGSAQDPAAAEELVVTTGPNAVLLDLDLWSGGLEAIERIMATRATSIVVIGPAAEHPEAAIAAGAVDVVGALDVAPGTPEYANIVVRHLKIASRVRVITHPRGRLRSRGIRGPSADRPSAPRTPDRATGAPEGQPKAESPRVPPGSIERHVQRRSTPGQAPPKGPLIVAIGASTGGPPALATILAELPADLPASVIVVQHMAEGFVEGLARWLDGVCPLPVVVAVDGERVVPGQVYLAPANQNLLLRPGYRIALQDAPPGQFHVPGVDVTFRSVAEVSRRHAVGALLTGMGRDGAAGLKVMRDIGAFTIGQDESTSVVWGMPAAAQEADAVDLELPLPAISQAIVTAVAHWMHDVEESVS